MHRNYTVAIRATAALQVVASLWFVFAPDLLPEALMHAEMQNDQPLYENLDAIIVPLVHIQTLLCVALLWPTRVASWAYVGTTVSIAVLGSFAGPAMLSAIDAVVGYVQVVASGAMLCALYFAGYFGFRVQEKEAHA